MALTSVFSSQMLEIEDPGLREALRVALAGQGVPRTDQWRVDEIKKRYHLCMSQPEMPPNASGRSHRHLCMVSWYPLYLEMFRVVSSGSDVSIITP